MNTSQLRRTSIATSAIAAALTLVSVVAPPSVSAKRPNPDPGTSAHSAVLTIAALEIDQIVAMRKTAAAQYYVDHALELNVV